jgi:hypothetical protein
MPPVPTATGTHSGLASSLAAGANDAAFVVGVAVVAAVLQKKGRFSYLSLAGRLYYHGGFLLVVLSVLGKKRTLYPFKFSRAPPLLGFRSLVVWIRLFFVCRFAKGEKCYYSGNRHRERSRGYTASYICISFNKLVHHY